MKNIVIFLCILFPFITFAQNDGDVEFVVKKQVDTTVYLSGVYACPIIKKSKFYIAIKTKAKSFSSGKSREIAKAVIQFFDGGVCKIYCIDFNRKGEVTTKTEVKDLVYTVKDSTVTITQKALGKGNTPSNNSLFYGFKPKANTINFVNDNQLVSIFNNQAYKAEKRYLVFTEYKLNNR